MDSSISPHDWRETRRTFVLWAGVLTGPLVWLSLLEVNYVLAHVSCAAQSRWFLHVAVAVALALVAAAGYASWSAAPAIGLGDHTATPPATLEGRLQRARWMSLAGVATSLWFVVVILAMEVPILVLRECQ